LGQVICEALFVRTKPEYGFGERTMVQAVVDTSRHVRTVAAFEWKIIGVFAKGSTRHYFKS